ncbi:MAG: hypothetical protein IKS03_10700, partial [Ruminococcus sp.]|nr:hypothetical protein [Ruminococcus sp.]
MDINDFSNIVSLIKNALNMISDSKNILNNTEPPADIVDFKSWIMQNLNISESEAVEICLDAKKEYLSNWKNRCANNQMYAEDGLNIVENALASLENDFERYIISALDGTTGSDRFEELIKKIPEYSYSENETLYKDLNCIRNKIREFFGKNSVKSTILFCGGGDFIYRILYLFGLAEKIPPSAEYYSISDYVSYDEFTGRYYFSGSNREKLREIFAKSELSEIDREKLIIICNFMTNSDGTINADMLEDFLNAAFSNPTYHGENPDYYDQLGVWSRNASQNTAMGLPSGDLENLKSFSCNYYLTYDRYKDFYESLGDENGIDPVILEILDYYYENEAKHSSIQGKISYSTSDMKKYDNDYSAMVKDYLQASGKDEFTVRIDSKIQTDIENAHGTNIGKADLYTIENFHSGEIKSYSSFDVYSSVENTGTFDGIFKGEIINDERKLAEDIKKELESLHKKVDGWETALDLGLDVGGFVIDRVAGMIPVVGTIYNVVGLVIDCGQLADEIAENKEYNEK